MVVVVAVGFQLLQGLSVTAELVPTCEELEDCTVKPYMPCSVTVYDFHGCPPPPTVSENFPTGSIRDLSVKTKIVLDQVYIQVTWKPPNDATAKYIKAFQVSVLQINNANLCFQYNLQGANWTEAYIKDEIEFGTKCWIPVSEHGQVSLYMSPEPAMEFPLPTVPTATFMYPKYINQLPPSDWSTYYIKSGYNSESGNLTVDFSTAPKYYNFTEYMIQLIPLSSTVHENSRVKVSKDDLPYRFRNVAPGTYNVTVQPVDDNPGQCSCKCRKSWDTDCPRRPCRKGCKVSEKTIKLAVMSPEAAGTTSSPAPQISPQPAAARARVSADEISVKQKILYAVIGTSGGVASLLFVALLVKFGRRKGTCQYRRAAHSSGDAVLQEESLSFSRGDDLNCTLVGQEGSDISRAPLLGTQCPTAESVSVQQMQYTSAPGIHPEAVQRPGPDYQLCPVTHPDAVSHFSSGTAGSDWLRTITATNSIPLSGASSQAHY